jgi:hypothetical protein
MNRQASDEGVDATTQAKAGVAERVFGKKTVTG